MYIFLDFDYTLFDAGAFRMSLKHCAGYYGVDETIFEACYQKARLWHEGNYGANYTIEKHVSYMKEVVSAIDIDSMVRKFYAYIDRVYLYEGVNTLLSMLQNTSHKIVLLSVGNPIFQQTKIERLDLDKYFDACVYVNGNKADYISHHTDTDETFICINDDLVENNAIYAIRPQAHIIIKRNIYRNSVEELYHSGFPFFETLTEIHSYVSQLI